MRKCPSLSTIDVKFSCNQSIFIPFYRIIAVTLLRAGPCRLFIPPSLSRLRFNSCVSLTSDVVVSSSRSPLPLQTERIRMSSPGNKEFFPEIKPIQYNPQASVEDVLAFKQYNQDEIILGKPMHEWLRFAVCFWHTFRGLGADMFGAATLDRPWDQHADPLEGAKARLRAAFELFTKLGVKYYTFHDRDIAPEGANIEETERNLDEIVQLAKQLQKETGVKCLWGTANLFSHPRYMNGAATNPDAHVFAYAAAQVKK